MNLQEQKEQLILALELLLSLKIQNCYSKDKAQGILKKIKEIKEISYYDKIQNQIRKDIKKMKDDGKINITESIIDNIIENTIEKYSKA